MQVKKLRRTGPCLQKRCLATRPPFRPENDMSQASFLVAVFVDGDNCLLEARLNNASERPLLLPAAGLRFADRPDALPLNLI
jgi:hypothetical protein